MKQNFLGSKILSLPGSADFTSYAHSAVYKLTGNVTSNKVSYSCLYNWDDTQRPNILSWQRKTKDDKKFL